MADEVAVDRCGLEARWRAVFAKHAAGQGSMAEVCARHGVAAGSWSFWKRKLGIEGAVPRPPDGRINTPPETSENLPVGCACGRKAASC